MYNKKAANLEACEKWCQMDTNCYFYTFVIKEKLCWLKTGRYFWGGALKGKEWGNDGSYTSGWQSCKYLSSWTCVKLNTR